MALGTKQKQLVGVLLAVAFCSVELVQCKSSIPQLQIGIKHRPAACSRRAQPGDEVAIHYTGCLDDEEQTVFMTTEGGDPLVFVLGEGEVIEGWEKGIMGMCVGERRKLKIPASMAYKDIGHPGLSIPGGANLVFQIEAASIEDGPEIIHLDADSMPVYTDGSRYLEL